MPNPNPKLTLNFYPNLTLKLSLLTKKLHCDMIYKKNNDLIKVFYIRLVIVNTAYL